MHAHSFEKSDGVTNVTVEALVDGNPLAEPILRNISEVCRHFQGYCMYNFLRICNHAIVAHRRIVIKVYGEKSFYIVKSHSLS